jgi:hypothetical protein
MKKRTARKWLMGLVMAWLIGMQMTVLLPSAKTWRNWKNSHLLIARAGDPYAYAAVPTATRTLYIRYSYPTPTPFIPPTLPN